VSIGSTEAKQLMNSQKNNKTKTVVHNNGNIWTIDPFSGLEEQQLILQDFLRHHIIPKN
jgi:hypothetical protein